MLAFAGRPLAENFHVFVGEFGVAVQPEVRVNRHAAACHFPANFLEIARLLASVILRPIGEVHLSAAFVDVIDDEPGDGRDVAIPGPARLVGMAIVAGAIEDCRRFGCELRMCFKRA